MTIEDDLLSMGIIQPHEKRYFTRETREKLARLSHYECERCGNRVAVNGGDFLNMMHAGHIVAWSRGGLNSWDNLVCLCASCNLEQGAKSPTAAFGAVDGFRISARGLVNGILYGFT